MIENATNLTNAINITNATNLTNATNITNATNLTDISEGVFIGLSPVLKTALTFLVGFLSGTGVIAVVLNFFFKKKLQNAQQEYEEKLRQRDIQILTGHVVDAFNDFTTSWGAFLEKQPPSNSSFSESAVMPILKTVSNIRAIIMGNAKVLSNMHFRALKIVDDIESIIKRLESPKGIDSNVRYVGKKEIEDLAERARGCAAKLGGGLSKK